MRSFDGEEGCLSAGCCGLVIDVDSVEKALGLKPRGDEARSGSSDRVWKRDKFSASSWRLGEGEIAERGETERAWFLASLACELGDDAASGLAIRKPPRDWDRLRSPSMVDSLVEHLLLLKSAVCCLELSMVCSEC